MKKSLSFAIIFIVLFFNYVNVKAQKQEDKKVVDRIVAIVNDHLILKSEVDAEVTNYLQRSQNLDFSKELWYQALNSVIENYVLLEKAKLDSVEVTDDRVNQAMDQRINSLVQRAGSENALEQSLGKSLLQIKAEFRERFREDMMVQQVRQQKMDEISITRPEVNAYFERIPQDSLPMIPERVALAQIVKIPPPEKNAREAAFQLAKTLRDSIINHGKNIEALARRHSDGPSASNGGLLPMMPLSDLVPEYSAAASALRPGEISQVVETTYGFHVIQLEKRISNKIETHHILIEVDATQMDNQVAIDKLNALRDSVINHNKDFGELARKHSDDKATAQMEGKLINPQTGERLIPIEQLDPSLYRISLILENEGDISEPKPFKLREQSDKQAFRIVQLRQRIPEHRANLEQDYEMVKRVALQRKQMVEMRKWIADILEEVFVDYKIPVPPKYNYSQS